MMLAPPPLPSQQLLLLLLVPWKQRRGKATERVSCLPRFPHRYNHRCRSEYRCWLRRLLNLKRQEEEEEQYFRRRRGEKGKRGGRNNNKHFVHEQNKGRGDRRRRPEGGILAGGVIMGSSRQCHPIEGRSYVLLYIYDMIGLRVTAIVTTKQGPKEKFSITPSSV